ncbi:MAG: hypothetical protein ACI8PT_000799 [Gammaproteobacteria bacterium]|jgi:hypothetical protein
MVEQNTFRHLECATLFYCVPAEHESPSKQAHNLKLHCTNVSPYVRKDTVTAIEAGVDSEIERIEPTVSVWVGEGDFPLRSRSK